MNNSPIVKTVQKTLPAVISIIIAKDAHEVEKELKSNLPPFLNLPEEQTKIPKEAIDAHGMVKIGGYGLLY